MKTEAIAQLMFWIGMGSLPFGVVLMVVGVISRNRSLSICCFVSAPMMIAHFFWYFKMLGIGLSDKIGNAEYPSWWLYISIAALFSLPLGLFTARWKKDRSKPSAAIDSI